MLVLLFSLGLPLGLANTFSVTGPCTASGNCFQSHDKYEPGFLGVKCGVNEECDITVNEPGILYAVEFETEPDFDFLTIGGTKYSGYSYNAEHVIPRGVSVTPGTDISWSSDEMYTKTGFEICMYPECTVGSNTVDCGCGTNLCVAATGLCCSGDGECSVECSVDTQAALDTSCPTTADELRLAYQALGECN